MNTDVGVDTENNVFAFDGNDDGDFISSFS